MEIPIELMSNSESYIKITYDNTINVLPSVINSVIALFAITALLLILIASLKYLRRTIDKENEPIYYRNVYTTAYIVGKMKEIAKEDKINLEQELKEFFKTSRLWDLNEENLDKVIEQELKEKLLNKNTK